MNRIAADRFEGFLRIRLGMAEEFGVDMVVVVDSHGPGRDHAATVATALAALLEGCPHDASAFFASANEPGLHIGLHPHASPFPGRMVCGEVVNPAPAGATTAPAGQAPCLQRLGWTTDLGEEEHPRPESFVQGWNIGDERVEDVAEVIATTLHELYGLHPADDLTVALIEPDDEEDE